MKELSYLINPVPINLQEPTHLSSDSITEKLPKTGLIASVVRIPDVDHKKEDNDIKRLVEWVNDPNHAGKVRFNAHGDDGGKVLMYTDSTEKRHDWVTADELVNWLVANGLKPAGDAKERHH
jgi:hypothetical protein